MALKTFNLDAELYKKYSAHCRKNGISMSKQVERFIAAELSKIGMSTGFKESAFRDRQINNNYNKGNDEHPMKKFC